MKTFNGVSFFKQSWGESEKIYVDACLDGIGAIWDNQVYCRNIKGIMPENLSIVHFETLNIVVALKTWANRLCRTQVTVYCDNMAAVMICQTGKTRDQFLAKCYRNLWLICAVYEIDLRVVHIKGSENVTADTLSRFQSNKMTNWYNVNALCGAYVWWDIPLRYLDLYNDI